MGVLSMSLIHGPLDPGLSFKFSKADLEVALDLKLPKIMEMIA